ncbi:MAG: hypothetical protein D6B25_16880 [Desulfobulbaceae bacterium]|nr:MAG: hypothetical protein D6B25_16880 [Desulfobulbaceae bacterium]
MDRKSIVLIVCDGLRADMISPELTPAICQFSQNAHRYTNYRSLFTSTTRVISASIATGCQPGTHGLSGNVVALQEEEGLQVRSVGNPDFRDRLRRLRGRTLNVPVLAERLAPLGESIVFSNVSPGAAYFHDPDGFGYVYHPAGSFGPGCKPLGSNEGLNIRKGTGGDMEMTRRFCEEILAERKPIYSVLWLSEPDFTGHHHPLGSDEHFQAVRRADQCVAEVLKTIDAIDGVDPLVIICSDHGQETIELIVPIDDYLIENGFKNSHDSKEIVVAPNGSAALIYLSPEYKQQCTAISSFLSRQPWVSQVYANQELNDIGQDGHHGPDLAIDLYHSDKPNAHGIAGECFIAKDPGGDLAIGCGSHGGLGAFVQRPFLMVEGGIFQGRKEVTVPASPISIAPTILHFLEQPFDAIEGQPLQCV